MNLARPAVLAVLIAAVLPSGAMAQTTTATLPQAERVVLTVEGKLRDGKPVDLTMEALRKLPKARIATTTPWHDGEQVFEGVPLAALLDHVGARGETLHVIALNKYRTEIPVSDLGRQPILAYLRNGAPMSVRDKGPLFVIYPYDRDPALKSELYYGRSAWQVRSISVD